jgi:diguanylate cyclase
MLTNEMLVVDLPDASSATSSKVPLRVLVAEESLDDFQLCVRTLQTRQWNVDAVQVASRELFETLISANTYDVVLADFNFPNWGGMQALEFLQEHGIDTPLILVAGPIGEEKAIQCIREGAADLILKTRLNLLPAAVCRAISERSMRETRKRAEATLRESESRFRALADSIATAVLIYRGTECRYANRAAQTLSGYTENELLALSSWDLIHPDSRSLLIERGLSRVRETQGAIRYETKILTKRGDVRFWDITLGKIEIDGDAAGLLTALDVTESKTAQAIREHGGYRDSLTGLLSAAQAQNIFGTEAKRSQRSGRSFSFIVLKLDELSRLAEEVGAAESSRLLCKLACSIGDVCRTADVASRFAEDEFVLILPETSVSGARRLVQRITDRLRTEPNELPFAMSAGIASFPQDGPTFEHALRAAKRALRKVDARAERELEHSA